MKIVILICAALVVLAFFTGCATVSRSDSTLIQPLLDKLLPADFSGPIDVEHSNQFFTISIQAGNVRKQDGRWVWDWLSYERKSHFPIFSGLTWSSTGKVHLGQPPK
jgi:hypothetical protein